jgi:hypothetical protein
VVFYCLSLFLWFLIGCWSCSRHCGRLLFVSVSMIFDWMFELFRQCGILLFVSVSVIFDWMFELFPTLW